jgi:predicted short-subunit dehydrogenase-like oxidoreductase (DUF2520 family)
VSAVYIYGAGKVGRGLATALVTAGYEVTLRPARQGLPRGKLAGWMVILAVRDRELTPLAEALAASGQVDARSVYVHVAGSLGPEVLAALRPGSRGVAQMHPMISFASPSKPPGLAKGNLRLAGDPVAVSRAKALGKRLRMTPRELPGLDTTGYHAAAGLVANGAAALTALGVELLVNAGVPEKDAPRLLGPLLRSVADNVDALGFPQALTGPVRRGDAGAVQRHLELLRRVAPDAVGLYIAASRAQIPLARTLGEAPAENFDAIAKVLDGK